jgi:hypothetical protein
MKKLYFFKIAFLISVLCLLTFTTSAQNKEIIFVGTDAANEIRSEDSVLLDSITAWPWVDVSYMSSDSFNTATAEALYEDGQGNVVIAGVIISESIGSNAVPNFALRDNFPVPSIVLECGVFSNAENKWSMFLEATDPGGPGGISGHDPPVEDDLWWKIVNNSHYITENYTLNQEVQYSTNTTTYGIGYIYGINGFEEILAVPKKTIAENPYAIGVIDDHILYMAVAHHYHEPGFATQDFYDVLHRGIEYMFEVGPPSGIQDERIQQRNNLSVFPNPASEQVTIRFASPVTADVQVSVFDITGKQVDILPVKKNIYGNNIIYHDVSDYSNGIYYIKLQIENRVEYTKMVIH